MAFNTFASATTYIPLANLDANFTAIGTSDAASTLYPTATTSITYGGAATNHIFNTSGNNGFGVASPTAAMHLRAGTATSPPIQLTTGTNLSTATGGAVEYDGTAVYATSTNTSGRGVILAPQMVRLNADRLKPNNSTSLESIFDAANDSLSLVANTLYYFKGMLFFSKTASATSSTITLGFIFSNTQQDIAYGICANAFGGTTSNSRSVITGATNTSIGLSTSAYTSTAFVEGFFKSNATTGGTITPAFAQSVVGSSAAPSVLAGSYFMLQPMSSNPSATVIAGNWT